MSDEIRTPGDDGEIPTAAPEAPRVNDGFVGRVSDLLAKPARLMVNIAAAPRWWQAALLTFVLISVFSYVTVPISAPEQLEMMRDSKLMQMMPEEDWQRMYDEALDKPPLQRAYESLGAGFTTLVMVLIFSAVLGFFARMSGGQGTMRQSLGIGFWSAIIPFGVASVVKMPLVMATESVFTVNIGLAALLPDGDPGTALYKVLMTYGDLFTWWGLVVMIIGFEVIHRMPRRSAVIAVVLPWALLAAIPLGISLLVM